MTIHNADTTIGAAVFALDTLQSKVAAVEYLHKKPFPRPEEDEQKIRVLLGEAYEEIQSLRQSIDSLGKDVRNIQTILRMLDV